MTDLTDRLSQAAEGSRELSDEVLLALGWKAPPETDGMSGLLLPDKWIAPDGTRFYGDGPGLGRPDPSRSVDDLLKMVPEEWLVNELCECELHPSGRPWFCLLHTRGERYTNGDKDAHAATPALALCIAIPKAQENGR